MKTVAVKATLPLMFVVLAGCQQSEFADLQAFMQQAGQGTQPALEPLPPLKQVTDYTYEPGEMPDPFKPRIMKSSRSGGGLQPDMSRQKEVLENFPLDALRMVGIIQQKGQMFALIKAPDNVLHRVRKGQYMGQNYGLVVGITDSGVELKELTQDGAGDWTESQATVALQE
jgi:type IV pilus assembly protein PilP